MSLHGYMSVGDCGDMGRIETWAVMIITVLLTNNFVEYDSIVFLALDNYSNTYVCLLWLYKQKLQRADMRNG